jgi:hypothetical protein
VALVTRDASRMLLEGKRCACTGDCKPYARVRLADRQYETAVAEYVKARRAYHEHVKETAA